MKKLEKMNEIVHFGSDYATLTDVHSELVPYYKTINALIDTVNEMAEAQAMFLNTMTALNERVERLEGHTHSVHVGTSVAGIYQSADVSDPMYRTFKAR